MCFLRNRVNFHFNRRQIISSGIKKKIFGYRTIYLFYCTLSPKNTQTGLISLSSPRHDPPNPPIAQGCWRNGGAPNTRAWCRTRRSGRPTGTWRWARATTRSSGRSASASASRNWRPTTGSPTTRAASTTGNSCTRSSTLCWPPRPTLIGRKCSTARHFPSVRSTTWHK